MKIIVFVLLLVLAVFMLGPVPWMMKFVITRLLAVAGIVSIAFWILSWQKDG